MIKYDMKKYDIVNLINRVDQDPSMNYSYGEFGAAIAAIKQTNWDRVRYWGLVIRSRGEAALSFFSRGYQMALDGRDVYYYARRGVEDEILTHLGEAIFCYAYLRSPYRVIGTPRHYQVYDVNDARAELSAAYRAVQEGLPIQVAAKAAEARLLLDARAYRASLADSRARDLYYY